MAPVSLKWVKTSTSRGINPSILPRPGPVSEGLILRGNEPASRVGNGAFTYWTTSVYTPCWHLQNILAVCNVIHNDPRGRCQ